MGEEGKNSKLPISEGELDEKMDTPAMSSH